MNAYQFAVTFRDLIEKEMKLPCTIGIGDNLLLSKLALDNAAKDSSDMIATWHYEDVPETLWKIEKMTDFWGINTRTEQNLNNKGIYSIYDLAHYDFFKMKEIMGVIGQQLIAHAWGIDRTNISERYVPQSKSISNSQILLKDYVDIKEINIVLREMVEQVATRLRNRNLQTSCVHVGIRYSKMSKTSGFSRQMAIPKTNFSKDLTKHCFKLFNQFYDGSPIRKIEISYSKLISDTSLQLNLFEPPEDIINNQKLDRTVDAIREEYGFDAIYHASSQLEGATAIARSHLVGGHAGGMEGINQKSADSK